MRATRSIVLACAAAAAILPATLAGASSTTTHARPAVPASAGKLVQGPIHYMWARGHGPQASLKTETPSKQTGATLTPTVDTSNDLKYGGGPATGTVSTQPAVYIVFWGSQWNQSDLYADYLQRFLKGLYTTGDSWTTVANQYCEGTPGIAAGATSCPASGVTHVGPPSGSLVKGVWWDNALPAVPYTSGLLNFPTTDAMASEAVAAAAHFGNTGAGSNTNTQYVIALPPHAIAPGEGYYCAYHSSVSSNYGDVAYTNLPYLTENVIGSLCGENSVNARGMYDGVSIVEGHEYMETITDMRPRTGWTDSSGQENGDKCAWITSGQGAMANITTTTGTFAVQSTWSNALNGGAGGCAISG
jgi:serine protease